MSASMAREDMLRHVEVKIVGVTFVAALFTEG